LTAYLDLADYLLIAEAVLGVPAELIADFNRIGLADSALAAPRAGFGSVEAYPELAAKAAVGDRELQWDLLVVKG
jgi:death-on-curing protein